MKFLSILLVISLTGCISTIKRISPSNMPPPVTSVQNATLTSIEEPLTGKTIPSTPDNITLYANEVFAYLALIVLLICCICIIPGLLRYLSSKIRRSDRLSDEDTRIVLND